ncbi:MAG: ABC transporter permease, partial [Candidatus Latescibacterota bacterium]
MLTHYMTIAWRRLRQQRLSSTLSLAGLSLAIAYALLALTYVRQELTYDAFNIKADRIYQVVQYFGLWSGRELTSTPQDLGPEQVRGCAAVVRMARMTKVLLQVGHSLAASAQWVPLLCADPEILQVFDLPLVKASSRQPLAETNGVVLTEAAARHWFPYLNPLGRVLRLYTRRYDTAGFGQYDLEPHSLTVTGVLRDLPPNPSLTLDLLLPRATAQRLGLGGVEGLFVELTPDADPQAVAAELSGLAARNGRGPSTKPEYRLQPLRSLHFGKEEYDQLGSAPAGRLRHVAILAGMGALVLIVAILAHAVLATAQTGVRVREIGVRKAAGATVGQVRCQFWGESVVMSFLGLGVGLVLAWGMAGPFGALVDRRIEILGQFPGDLLGALGLALVTGLLAGWYPALTLSRAAPTDVLRGTRSGRGRGRFSRGLMVVQLGLCVFLAVCMVVMAAQLLFLQRKDLGFDGDHVVAVSLMNNGTPEVVQTFRERLQGAEGVVAVSATEHAPNISSLIATWRYSDEEVLLNGFRVEVGFMDAMGLRLIAGRWLDPAQDTPTGSVVVNEALVRRLGWADPVGRRL